MAKCCYILPNGYYSVGFIFFIFFQQFIGKSEHQEKLDLALKVHFLVTSFLFEIIFLLGQFDYHFIAHIFTELKGGEFNKVALFCVDKFTLQTEGC